MQCGLQRGCINLSLHLARSRPCSQSTDVVCRIGLEGLAAVQRAASSGGLGCGCLSSALCAWPLMQGRPVCALTVAGCTRPCVCMAWQQGGTRQAGQPVRPDVVHPADNVTKPDAPKYIDWCNALRTSSAKLAPFLRGSYNTAWCSSTLYPNAAQLHRWHTAFTAAP